MSGGAFWWVGAGQRPHRRWPRALWAAALLAVGAHLVMWSSLRAGWAGKHSSVAGQRMAAPGGHDATAASDPTGGAVTVRMRVPPITVTAVDALLPQPMTQPKSSGAPQPDLSPAAAEPVGSDVPARADGGRAGVLPAYWPTDQIAQAPQPDSGWMLDEEALASVRRGRLHVRLWVSADGVIDRVVLLSSEPAGAWAMQAIQPLPSTRMQPGRLEARAVPSTLVVEITSEIERFR